MDSENEEGNHHLELVKSQTFSLNTFELAFETESGLDSKGGARTSPGEEQGAIDFSQGQKSFPESLFET